ncbi:hypothetical protein ACFORH_10830 [Amycolatopsis roodepoortensis]|uniref:Uncharacterized protein n=1 Tax=Amycolatopsis roodepoortensis TaxID=700274 RepID=A0ABR9LAJ0_9PSEU|nr:hypothetical protein [Amycolatopsis roodepoortensis]MBE1577671.1 hypothetical protein [Amycolatopsis roodepoortensis]
MEVGGSGEGRLSEDGVTGEGRVAEGAGSDARFGQVEVDELGVGEVEVELASVGGAVAGFEVVVEDALNGEPDFAFLDKGTVLLALVGMGIA